MGNGAPSSPPVGAAVPRRADGKPARLLVVDDETVLTDLLLDSLTFIGFEVHTAHSGSDALSETRRLVPDLMLLDVNLPDFNGFAVAARMRATGDNTPIVFLTARDAPADLRDGFGTGADDYLTKPFRLEELRLRVEAVLRRTLGTSTTTRDEVITVGDLVLDTSLQRTRRGDVSIRLNSTQFRLLHYLASHRNKVLSAADLTTHVWGASDGVDVARHIAELKSKIDFTTPSLIHTAGTSGYILRTPKT